MDAADNILDQPAERRSRRYDAMSMIFHWLTLALLMILFGAIRAREQASDGDTAVLLLTVHRSAGTLIWIMTLARLVWKLTGARAPALPSSMPQWQQAAARANEYTLYCILIAQPVTGFLQSVMRGKPFALLGLSVPAVMARDRQAMRLLHNGHETIATVLLVLVGLHACAALFHGVVRRDGVLRSMLPGRPRLVRK